MTLTIADFVTDGEVFCMAVAAVAERLNVLQRGGFARHVFAANPARHHTMQLTGYRLVDFVAGMAQSAHNIAGSVSAAAAVLSPLTGLGVGRLNERILPVRRKPAGGA